MITSRLPYSEYDNPMTSMFHIANGKLPSLHGNNCSPELLNFIYVCCAADPAKRPSVDQLSLHTILIRNPNVSGPEQPNSLDTTSENFHSPVGSDGCEAGAGKDAEVQGKLGNTEDFDENDYLNEQFYDDDVDSVEEDIDIPIVGRLDNPNFNEPGPTVGNDTPSRGFSSSSLYSPPLVLQAPKIPPLSRPPIPNRNDSNSCHESSLASSVMSLSRAPTAVQVTTMKEFDESASAGSPSFPFNVSKVRIPNRICGHPLTHL